MSEARIRVIQITDVYILNNFPHVKNLIKEKRAEMDEVGGKTFSVLTGDFLAPYLLSSFDKGSGMMSVINKTPIDYLTWGNHEHDLEHEFVLEREKEYKGIWINTNMQSHESFKDSKCQVDRAIVEVVSPDGSNKRRLGMMGILTNTESLYKPNKFGGATIDDPWETMKVYNAKLKGKDKCDMVLPLCHLYEAQDERTCKEFDFPVIMSGHDHHVVDRVVDGTRLLKPGMDANNAVVMDLIWDNADSGANPRVEVQIIKTTDYPADHRLAKRVKRAYSRLNPLLRTDLVIIPSKYKPLTSKGVREKRCTMATYLCTAIRDALNMDQKKNVRDNCDCVLIKGGNFRGERDYVKHNFTLEGLRTELHEEEGVHIFRILGKVLKKCIAETIYGPNPGWMQYDEGVDVDDDGMITCINGLPINDEMMYRVGSFQDFHIDYGNQPTLADFYKERPDLLPDPDSNMGCHVVLLQLYSAGIWRRIWSLLDADGDGQITPEELAALDTDGDGQLSRKEVKEAMAKLIGLSTHEDQDALVDFIMKVAGDEDNDGQLTVDELNAAH